MHLPHAAVMLLRELLLPAKRFHIHHPHSCHTSMLHTWLNSIPGGRYSSPMSSIPYVATLIHS